MKKVLKVRVPASRTFDGNFSSSTQLTVQKLSTTPISVLWENKINKWEIFQ